MEARGEKALRFISSMLYTNVWMNIMVSLEFVNVACLGGVTGAVFVSWWGGGRR